MSCMYVCVCVGEEGRVVQKMERSACSTSEERQTGPKDLRMCMCGWRCVL